MSKVTDEQVLSLKTRVDNQDVTVIEGCKKLKINPVTYYRRLDKLMKKNEECKEIARNVTDMLPVTIQEVQQEIQSIISELKEMKGKDTREQLQIMDRKINALDKLNNTLKTTSIMIDNRTVNVEIRKTIETDVCQWVYDTVLSKGGPELASKVLDMLQGD